MASTNKFSNLNNANPAYIENLYLQFKKDPSSVDQTWADFFMGYEFNQDSSTHTPFDTQSTKEISVIKLIQGYRSRGHLISDTNPIRKRRIHKTDLTLDFFNLSEDDLNTEFESGKEINIGKATLANILSHLNKTYCSSIGVEFTYCRNEKLREWIQSEMETNANKEKFKPNEQLKILNLLTHAVIFENFLQTKYIGKKRFSLEGLEVVIPALTIAIEEAARTGAKELILGMAHRGRLNVLANVFQKSYDEVFSEFEENYIHDFINTGGDVKYHLGKSEDIVTEDGKKIHLSMVPNPSHLEAVSPVLQGISYSKKLFRYNNNENAILPIVIHGDAAISGQGVNYEVANMSKLEGYDNGGTIHIVTNNQVGFTANYKESRSSVYCTDLAKVTESPVFHINADDPEAVLYAMDLAVKIRQEFHQDVYIDILGYRKYGHNEGDEPRFTQPLLYKKIAKHKNVHDIYLEKLIEKNIISKEDAQKQNTTFKKILQDKLDQSKLNPIEKKLDMFKSSWKNFRLATDKDFTTTLDTSVNKKTLDTIVKQISTIPKNFNLFSKTNKILTTRHTNYQKNKSVDWAMAELLAYGSLLTEGHPVRISGQDAQRGTFSHRHAIIKDTETEEQYTPLNHISKNQEKLHVYNSLLSEYAVLAFEYGYSLADPNSLVIWEAQFGDFANGAQIVIDQFISNSEVKWQKVSGLVMLLPHGYEGQGPEHSSARLERYLQLCAENNMIVCNITTPANFFHVLRKQMKQPFRKPLIIMSPKSLLRHPKVISSISDLTSGHFKETIDDNTVDPKKVKKVILCSGKIYYDLTAEKQNDHIAILRLEQLYPLPIHQLNVLKKKYNKAQWVWAQEEPENMGAWTHILRHLRDWNLTLISRPEGASTATGSSKVHTKSQLELIKKALDNKS